MHNNKNVKYVFQKNAQYYSILIKTFSGLNLFFMLKPVSKYVLTGFNLLIKSNSRNIQTSFIIVLPIIGVKL